MIRSDNFGELICSNMHCEYIFFFTYFHYILTSNQKYDNNNNSNLAYLIARRVRIYNI